MHAFGRMQLSVVGDEVTSYRTFIKIPDEWRRQREEQSVARTIFTFLPVLLVLGFGGTVLVFFLREIKSDLMREVPWRRFSLWGLYGVVAYITDLRVCRPHRTGFKPIFDGDAAKVRIRRTGYRLSGGNVFLSGRDRAAAMAWFFLRQAFAETDFPGWRGMAKNYYRDALLIGVGGTAALLTLKRVSDWMSAHWPTPHQSLGAAFGNDFDSVLPGISISATAMLHGLLFAGTIGDGGFCCRAL